MTWLGLRGDVVSRRWAWRRGAGGGRRAPLQIDLLFADRIQSGRRRSRGFFYEGLDSGGRHSDESGSGSRLGAVWSRQSRGGLRPSTPTLAVSILHFFFWIELSKFGGPVPAVHPGGGMGCWPVTLGSTTPHLGACDLARPVLGAQRQDQPTIGDLSPSDPVSPPTVEWARFHHQCARLQINISNIQFHCRCCTT